MSDPTEGGRGAGEAVADLPFPGSPEPGRILGGRIAASRRMLADAAAGVLVTAGGISIIASILGILVFIVLEVLPLTFAARVEPVGETVLPGDETIAMVGDEYRTHVALLGSDGVLRVVRAADGEVVLERNVVAPGSATAESPLPLSRGQVPPGGSQFMAATADGRVVSVPIEWEIEFSGARRSVRPRTTEPWTATVDSDGRPVGAYAARVGSDGSRTLAAQRGDGSLLIVRQRQKENLFTGEVETSEARSEAPGPGLLTRLVLDEEQSNLYGADANGHLYWWRLGDERPGTPQVVSAGGSAVTALTLLLGGRSLVVGQQDGSLSVWFVVRGQGGEETLTRIRDFPAHAGPIRVIEPSRRDKGFFAWDDGGTLDLYHSTSHRVMWTGNASTGVRALFYTPKGDALFIAGDQRLYRFDVHNPHPEVSWQALFGRVWYEGYERPEFVWQSSGGTDDFEPKLSLTPLLVGTLKGTFFSLLIAIPLAVLGAMYTSQFMHPSLKRLVKPTVEIMAALPSVVLGFLAGLWLAPRVETAFPALLLMVVLLPPLTLAAGVCWQAIPRRWRGHVPLGSEALVFVVVLALGIWACLHLGPPFERLAFAGSFQSWLLDTLGLPYDQRNAIIVGLAMGFAVIPIIFAISEEAFSNVPRDLVSGSLALGANRWQTVTRIVLPTASPGIFSAVMVGFGRAVGETMIVLMATGNTPIMDWNPFNGFRTLSANIAVEIPEAPQFGTLYRVLFLAALLLFVVTFAVNTVAEVVRQRLRRRYAQL
jgi:phosphate transport system permease protein